MTKTSEDWERGQDNAKDELEGMMPDKVSAKEVAAWFTRNKNEAGWKALAKIFVEVVQE